MTQQCKNKETAEERSLRLKRETLKAIERLWLWAQNDKVFGEILVKAKFEDGQAIRITLSPTEMKT